MNKNTSKRNQLVRRLVLRKIKNGTKRFCVCMAARSICFGR